MILADRQFAKNLQKNIYFFQVLSKTLNKATTLSLRMSTHL